MYSIVVDIGDQLDLFFPFSVMVPHVGPFHGENRSTEALSFPVRLRVLWTGECVINPHYLAHPPEELRGKLASMV